MPIRRIDSPEMAEETKPIAIEKHTADGRFIYIITHNIIYIPASWERLIFSGSIIPENPERTAHKKRIREIISSPV